MQLEQRTSQQVCDVEPGTALWAKLEKTRVIVWDEATMSDSRVYRCVNDLLKRVIESTKNQLELL